MTNRITIRVTRLFWAVLYRTGIPSLFSDVFFSKLLYFCCMGRRLNLQRPFDFNQKVQWIKLYYHNPMYVTCADKYAVREYVKEKIGSQYLNECIGLYDKVEDIKLSDLPERFVLKATHGSGWNLICTDKTKVDWVKACRKMQGWLNRDFSMIGREWQYHHIEPRIICEAFMSESDGSPLRDFKLFTFNGQAKYIAVQFTRQGEERINFYDAEWNFQPEKQTCPGNDPSFVIARPACLDEMKSLAKTLASEFPLCRVDFYVLGERRVVFGELTFTPGKGCNDFSPQSFCDELGGCVVLPEKGYV